MASRIVKPCLYDGECFRPGCAFVHKLQAAVPAGTLCSRKKCNRPDCFYSHPATQPEMQATQPKKQATTRVVARAETKSSSWARVVCGEPEANTSSKLLETDANLLKEAQSAIATARERIRVRSELKESQRILAELKLELDSITV
jgi:hypothetical protein